MHTLIQFLETRVLKFHDMHLLKLGIFVYSHQNRTLPLKFDCKFSLQKEIHELIGSCILWGAATNVSVDISVTTRSSIDQYLIEYRPIHDQVLTNVSTDTLISRYTWWFTDTSLILHRYFTDTSSILSR